MGENRVEGTEATWVALGEDGAPGYDAVSVEEEMSPCGVTLGVAHLPTNELTGQRPASAGLWWEL